MEQYRYDRVVGKKQLHYFPFPPNKILCLFAQMIFRGTSLGGHACFVSRNNWPVIMLANDLLLLADVRVVTSELLQCVSKLIHQ
jgi:hypothetical protein